MGSGVQAGRGSLSVRGGSGTPASGEPARRTGNAPSRRPSSDPGGHLGARSLGICVLPGGPGALGNTGHPWSALRRVEGTEALRAPDASLSLAPDGRGRALGRRRRAAPAARAPRPLRPAAARRRRVRPRPRSRAPPGARAPRRRYPANREAWEPTRGLPANPSGFLERRAHSGSVTARARPRVCPGARPEAAGECRARGPGPGLGGWAWRLREAVSRRARVVWPRGRGRWLRGAGWGWGAGWSWGCAVGGGGGEGGLGVRPRHQLRTRVAFRSPLGSAGRPGCPRCLPCAGHRSKRFSTWTDSSYPRVNPVTCTVLPPMLQMRKLRHGDEAPSRTLQIL